MQTQQSAEAEEPVTHSPDSLSRACYSGLPFLAEVKGACARRVYPRTLPLTLLIPYSRGRGRSISSLGVLVAACLYSQHILLLRSRQGRKHLVWSGCTECLVPVWLPPPHQLQTAEPKKSGNRMVTAGGLAGAGEAGDMSG